MNAAPDMNAGTSAQELLDGAATELLRLRECALDLQVDIVSMTGKGGAMSAATVSGLQEVDRLTQELEGLSAYLSGLARVTPGQWSLDPSAALDAVTMQSQRKRLGSGPCSDGGQMPDDDLELFNPGATERSASG